MAYDCKIYVDSTLKLQLLKDLAKESADALKGVDGKIPRILHLSIDLAPLGGDDETRLNKLLDFMDKQNYPATLSEKSTG